MEYETPPTATAFPRKLRSRTHSLSFSTNVVYDGVFASPASKKSALLLDYGEMFRGSGTSSSIPFLDVPELKEGKVTVDVRSSKLDYSSVFGGLEVCEFAVSPEELFIKSKKRSAGKEEEWNAGKAGKCYARNSNEVKNQIASPEAVRMKQLNMSYHHSNPSIENGMNGITLIAKVHALSGYAGVVDDTCPSQKSDGGTFVSSVEVEPCNEGPTPVSPFKMEPSNEGGMVVNPPVSSVKVELLDECPMEVKPPVSYVRMEPSHGSGTEVAEGNNAMVDIPRSNASSKCSTKTEGEFQKTGGRNSCCIGNNLADNACEIDCNAKQPDVTSPSSLRQSSYHDTDASERRMGSKSGVLETFDSPCSSPPYFDEETDANSVAAVSAAAVKKAIEEAQLRIKIAKQIMERKKEGFHSRVKSKSCDISKFEDKGNRKDERETEKQTDNVTQDYGEVVNSSKQTFPNEADHHTKRARKQWEVSGELLISTLESKQEDSGKNEAVELGEEHARRARKQWEIPGGISKSVVNGKLGDTENLAAPKLETHTNKEVQAVAENSFYTFGQLGNKIKSVVEAFTGSKVEQKNEVEGAECGIKDSHEGFKLSHEVSIQEQQKAVRVVEPREMSVVPSDVETYEREVEEVPRSNEDKSETQIDKNAEPDMNILTEECSLKEEKEIGLCLPAENASDSGNAPGGNEKENKTPRRRRFWKTSEDVYEMIRFPKGYRRACLPEDDKEEMVKRCLGEDSVKVDDTCKSEETDDTSQLHSDSGLQENWNVLKQMFRQMFQTVDQGREDETCRLVESEQMQPDINRRAETYDRKRVAGSSIYRLTGIDKCNDAYNEQDEAETFSLEVQAHVHTGENEDSKLTLVGHLHGEHGTLMGQTKELEAVEEASNQEEVVSEVSEAAGLAQGTFELHENKEHADNLAENFQDDQIGTNSSNSYFEQKSCEELAEETNSDISIENDEGESSELRHGYSDTEDVDLEQKLSDQSHEKASTASSTDEHVEEVDSESNRSGWCVEGMELTIEPEVHEDDFESFLEENLADYVEAAEASQPPCGAEESDDMKTSQSSESEKQEYDFECPSGAEFDNRRDAEAAETPIPLPKGDEETDAASVTNTKDNDVEERCRSLTEEKREVTADAPQKEVEPVEEHLKKTEAKEKKRERETEKLMVERAIREARERAFAEARERAERAAMEKANTGLHRRATTGIRVKSEKPSVEVNEKSSSSEKASMQAKLRAERAAVERALNEARERALEKALSGKAASQARTQGSKQSGFSSSGTHSRSSSSSKSYADTNSSNQSVQRCRAKSETHQRTDERVAKALAEKKLRDIIAQKEQAERNRFAEILDAEVKRWSNGKEGNLRALLSTLQYILGPESGWKPIPLTELVSNAAVRKAYRKATLYVHPDKLQQRGAGTQQKYTCEKVFDLLKEAWNKFSTDER